jgi:aconitate hydratase
VLRLADLRRVLVAGGNLLVENVTRQHRFPVRHSMSPRQVQFLLSGGLINWMKERISAE